ncbi:MAG: bifunctional phosphopantothenoylcysteine decarboxylase/phosphopantothenate--cysteine ligase CoaBC [Acidimicrobiaceae bacterium]|jgi:phosphopantothenoylcysteine decarboxylase/phosphopantothenate--cysteine ligase|nr:bifunctional phosphopantothenoylcysteine decarboxylase/phosphopantothenate--cysteine ligase CoaBC [Acidimicrobiaceae bacterium]|tara:strand:- start:2841 stop:4031 length:1191 start_codon:yes stop_codon:yes gene_type:complete
MISGKKVVLGITGGIAAYKSVEVVRRLVEGGAHVAPIMTSGAKRFIGEVTLSALASEPVKSSLWDEDDPIPHTTLGQEADVILVAPATARLIGTYAAGISNDLLTATLLASRAPVILCPAMHTEMWEHPAVQENIRTLQNRGVTIVAPEDGKLAGGDEGKGRLASPSAIVSAVEQALTLDDLAEFKILITAGGTREQIDPVRFITNKSTGKQGYALAEAAVARGATVTLVTTVDREAPIGVEIQHAESASDLRSAVMSCADNYDVIIMAAAVADFQPSLPADRKLKKSQQITNLEIEPTHDFLIDLGKGKSSNQIIVGFAAETEELEKNAKEKLERKNLDLIVANDVTAPGTGFAYDTNEVLLITGQGKTNVPLASKRVVADKILDAVLGLRESKV